VGSVKDLQLQVISRPNDPDFSDVFAMTEMEYQALLTEFGLEDATADNLSGEDEDRDRSEQDVNDPNNMGFHSGYASMSVPATVPGPYGPAWPLVTSPAQFELGSAEVTIEIEDENAKYPLNWVLIDDEKLKPLAEAGFVTFCEWMGYGGDDIDTLRGGLAQIGEIRTFKLEFKETSTPAAANTKSRTSARRRATAGRASRRTSANRSTAAKTKVKDPEAQQNADFSKLFHSSLIDVDLLTRPSIVTESRDESAMKYLGLWATKTVNINTAPRHVLEAALAFGTVADAPKIAELIIQQRREKPFENIEELKSMAFQYSDSIDKCKDFLATTSTVFTIKVTATSGVANATVVAAVTKEGDKVKRIGVISD
jgi:hypothetical protein